MKVIIELEFDDSLSNFERHNVNTRKEYYEKYHKERGDLFDDDAEAIYYEIDLPSIPTVGQRIGTRWGMHIVIWSYWELEESENNLYFNKSRILVAEESDFNSPDRTMLG